MHALAAAGRVDEAARRLLDAAESESEARSTAELEAELEHVRQSLG